MRDVAQRLDLQSQRLRHRAGDHRQGRAAAAPASTRCRSPTTAAPTKRARRSAWKDAFKAVYTMLRYARWEAPTGDVGAVTLRRMAGLAAYNRWLHDRFDAFLGRRVLEVGSGVGNQTRYFADRERVVASDIEPHYLRELRRRFEDTEQRARRVVPFPLAEAERADLRGERIDSIVCMNVLEHIEQRRRRRCATSPSVLRAGRPPDPARAGRCRRSTARSTSTLHHFRRYDKAGLTKLVSDAGFDVRGDPLPEPPGRRRLVAQLARAEAHGPAEGPARGLQVADAAASSARRPTRRPSGCRCWCSASDGKPGSGLGARDWGYTSICAVTRADRPRTMKRPGAVVPRPLLR